MPASKSLRATRRAAQSVIFIFDPGCDQSDLRDYESSPTYRITYLGKVVKKFQRVVLRVSGVADDIKNVVINDWGDITASVRTRASGKERVTIEIRGEALQINLDPMQLAKPVAEALAAEISKGVRTFHGFASTATRAARERAARAFEEGKSWARRRYSGGQTGAMPPNQTGRLLVDSGRLAKSIQARPTRNREYVVNVAANRLTEEPVRSRTLALLRPIVEAATKSDAVAKGVAVAKDLMVQKKRQQLSELMGKFKETLGNLEQLGDAMDEFSEEEKQGRR